jgi:hypothetical protein
MPETFRMSKLEKFIAKQVAYMENQQRVIEAMRKQHQGGSIDVEKLLEPIKYNQTAWHNYTFELCREFGIEMPRVLGVTPK